MPAWTRVRSAQSVTATSIVTTTETVLATTPSLSPDGATPLYTILGIVVFTVGTTTTSVTVRVRRGTGITGTAVITIAGITVTAANVVAIPFQATDQPGDVADQQYVATVQQAGATANGTNVASAIAALADV